jgi:hypothetical protein
MPDNSAYMVVAYVAAAVLYGGYAALLWWRTKKLKR